MEYLFQVSGVRTFFWLPPMIAFVISFFSSMGGISGAFLLLPFQMSYLGFTSPAVSSTNLIFNIVATPSGILRYLREGRIVWPLALMIIIGSIPGVIIGCLIRLHLFSSPSIFKIFISSIIGYIALLLLLDFNLTRKNNINSNFISAAAIPLKEFKVEKSRLKSHQIYYRFQGKDYQASSWGIFLIALVVGIVGGIYGIGGGAILVPLFITIYKFPVYTVTGAALVGTFITSLVGVFIYQLLAYFPAYAKFSISPDWLLGALFGFGGMIGMYLGARTQRFISASWLKLGLGILLLYIAGSYLIDFIKAINKN